MSNQEDRLDPLIADKLAEEAARMSPAFSPLLHERIMQRVRQGHTPTSGRDIERNWWALTAFAAAAAIALVVTVNWFGLLPSIRPGYMTAVAIHPSTASNNGPRGLPLPSIDPSALASVAAPAGEQLSEAKYAYLDRDAQRLTKYMIEQVNVLPVNR